MKKRPLPPDEKTVRSEFETEGDDYPLREPWLMIFVDAKKKNADAIRVQLDAAGAGVWYEVTFTSDVAPTTVMLEVWYPRTVSGVRKRGRD